MRQEVAANYSPLYRRHPDLPGLHLNEAFAALNADDGEAFNTHLELCLKACSNYLPAFQVMHEPQSED